MATTQTISKPQHTLILREENRVGTLRYLRRVFTNGTSEKTLRTTIEKGLEKANFNASLFSIKLPSIKAHFYYLEKFPKVTFVEISAEGYKLKRGRTNLHETVKRVIESVADLIKQ